MPGFLDRRLMLPSVAVVAAIGVVAYGPIPQDPAYHAFSDQRTILGIPHFWNVVSNAPFAIAGILGLAVVARRPTGMIAENALAYVLFFAGAVLIAFGSSWYHLSPTNATLVWDRLPMTISLMAFFDLVIGEHVDVRFARRALLPLVAIGIASAAYWGISERLGRSDLRPYAIVQFLPLLLIPIMLVAYPSRLTRVAVLWVILGCYGLAKVFELLDGPIHRMVGVVGGHPLKHLAAAAAIFVFVWGLDRRAPHRPGHENLRRSSVDAPERRAPARPNR
jgi:hypothetical protein